MKHLFSKKENEDKAETTTDVSKLSDLAKKLGRFFSPEPQKEKVLRQEDFTAAGDVYYANVSAGYKVAQRFLWLLFILFMVFSIFFHRQDITYDNFFYLMRDFSSAVDAETTNYETVSYESSPGQRFALYRGGVASVSPSRISAFTTTGRRTLKMSSEFSAPFAVASDQYLLVYDTAGKTFSVYNSFSRIYTETLTNPITNACFAEDGSFAVITRDAGHRAVVHVYYPDENFKRDTYRWNAYMFDVAMDSDNDRLVFVFYGAGDGTGETLISLRQKSTMEEITSVKLSGEFPLDCGFLENNKFALITDGAVRIFDKSFDEGVSQAYEYNGGITGFSITEEGLAVSLINSSKNEVIAFDKDGELVYHDMVGVNVTDIGIVSNYLFLQTETEIVRFDVKTREEGRLPCSSGKMLLYNANTAVVCGDSKAQYLIFDR